MKKLFTVLAVLGCAMLMSTPAMAVCVEDTVGPDQTYCLDTPNAVPSNAIVVQVDLHIDGANSTLTVDIVDTAGNSNLKIFTVGMYNNNGQLFESGPGGWTELGATCCDGAGFSFGAGGSQTPASSIGFHPGGDTNSPITFNLSAAPTFGDGGPIFAVHIGGLDNGCSIWLTNGNPSSQGTNGSNCGSTEVPEPGSLALLGTGLFSAVGVLRRKFTKA